jgi:hypothetical protein
MTTRERVEKMQVSVHGVENAFVADFTGSNRTHSARPFVALHLEDGKTNDAVFYLTTAVEASRLMEAAREAMELLGIEESVSAS